MGALSVQQRPDGVAVVRFDVLAEPVNTLQSSFASEVGARFAPAPMLLALAEAGGSFYGARAVASGEHRG
ncbi:MAG: hypothetical protein ABI488_00315 [Polyangiaceae bacterium]